MPLLAGTSQQFLHMRLLRNNGSGVLVDGGIACAQRIGWPSQNHGARAPAMSVDYDGDGDIDMLGTRATKNIHFHGPAAPSGVATSNGLFTHIGG